MGVCIRNIATDPHLDKNAVYSYIVTTHYDFALFLSSPGITTLSDQFTEIIACLKVISGLLSDQLRAVCSTSLFHVPACYITSTLVPDILDLLNVMCDASTHDPLFAEARTCLIDDIQYLTLTLLDVPDWSVVQKQWEGRWESLKLTLRTGRLHSPALLK